MNVPVVVFMYLVLTNQARVTTGDSGLCHVNVSSSFFALMNSLLKYFLFEIHFLHTHSCWMQITADLQAPSCNHYLHTYHSSSRTRDNSVQRTGFHAELPSTQHTVVVPQAFLLTPSYRCWLLERRLLESDPAFSSNERSFLHLTAASTCYHWWATTVNYCGDFVQNPLAVHSSAMFSLWAKQSSNFSDFHIKCYLDIPVSRILLYQSTECCV